MNDSQPTNDPQPNETPAEQIERLRLALQEAIHDLHQRADVAAELETTRVELAEVKTILDAHKSELDRFAAVITTRNAELEQAMAQLTTLQGELTPDALPAETLRGWRFAAEALIAQGPNPGAEALLLVIAELEHTRVVLAAIRGELAARATAESLLTEDEMAARHFATAFLDGPLSDADRKAAAEDEAAL